MIYVDASAIVKLIVDEHESTALSRWVDGVQAGISSSVLSLVEVVRACRRIGTKAGIEAARTLADFDLIPVNELILELAADVQPRDLRALDAIHLATALSIREELVGFVTYDRKLAQAAIAEGFEVTAPR